MAAVPPRFILASLFAVLLPGVATAGGNAAAGSALERRQSSGAASKPIEGSEHVPSPRDRQRQPWRMRFAPGSHLYPRYLANPRGAFIQGQVLSVRHSDTPHTRSPWLHFTLGGRLRLLRFYPATDPDCGLQLSAEAAFLGRFDPKEHVDAIGWDGVYSFMLAYKLDDQWSFKFAEQHDSGHVADEYIRKTGRERITYTREELNLGVRFSPWTWLSSYFEVGHALHLGNPRLLKAWRYETGIEVRVGAMYLALDETLFEDSGYRLNTTAQLGLMRDVTDTGQRYGLALQAESARSVLGEFFQDRVATVGFGVWADL